MYRNKLYGLAAATAFLAAATFPALAIEPQERPAGAPATGMEKSAKAANAQQRVSGTVTEIDQSKGLVTLSSADGALKLHFPPQSIAELKKGDKITAQYALAKTGAAEESTRAFDAPKGLGEHRMSGTVGKVDHAKGWVQLKTNQTTLEFRFPPQAVHDLKDGDHISVDMAYSKGS